MALRIVLLNMLELRRLPKSGHIPIQIPHPLMNRRISTSDISHITLEMLHVYRIEPHDGGVQADVSLGDVFSEVVGIGIFGEMFFDAVEGVEEWVHGGFVGGLTGGEAGFVDAVIDVVVSPIIGCFDFRLKALGEKVDLLVFLGNDVVKFGVKHTNDLAGLDFDDRLAGSREEICNSFNAYLVADNLVLFNVVEGRHREATLIIGADIEIEVS